MGLLNWAVVGAAGYGLYKYFQKEGSHHSRVAFADGESFKPGGSPVRNAGPEAIIALTAGVYVCMYVCCRSHVGTVQ